MTARLAHVDGLKAGLVAWIIGGHALLGYSAVGGWPYDEVNEVTFQPAVEAVLAALIGPSGLFVIGVLFFLAGLFTPAALARAGRAAYLRGRLVRLGVPFAVSALLVWPLSVWVAYRAAGWEVSPWWVFAHRDPPLDSGSLWFAAVLLLFSAVYALLPHRTHATRATRAARPLGARHLVALAAAIAATTFLVRLAFPARSGQPGDLHLWQWPQCAAMFAFGTIAARHGWASAIPDPVHRVCGLFACTALVVVPAAGLLAGLGELDSASRPYLGGWSVPAAALAVAEAVLVVAGAIVLLGAAQRRITGNSEFRHRVSDAAFAAFVIQGPVLMLLASALRPLPTPAEVKAPVVGLLAVAVCFGVGAFARRPSGSGSKVPSAG
ncbi:acyltransferase [Actinokineospora guangxiensis]|uniref:Acyltransferase n=1 Tax=Actinokineospora guangxiensis TaxID=1490288 RepID=A0ABW0EKN4_9PSEU